MSEFSDPRWFQPGSPELAAYVAAATAAGYVTTVSTLSYVLCNPAPTRPALKVGDAGIDVSHWQGQIDWVAVARDRVRFAFMKASENGFPDPTFTRNWDAAGEQMLWRGAYLFARPDQPVARQVDLFLSQLEIEGAGELPVAIDLEYYSGMGAIQPDAWLTRTTEIIESVKAAGHEQIIYTNGWALQNLYQWFTRPTLPWWAGTLPLWIARYTRVAQPLLPRGWTTWAVWQWDNGGQTWSTPQPGVRGKCDRNRWGATQLTPGNWTPNTVAQPD